MKLHPNFKITYKQSKEVNTQSHTAHRAKQSCHTVPTYRVLDLHLVVVRKQIYTAKETRNPLGELVATPEPCREAPTRQLHI